MIKSEDEAAVKAMGVRMAMAWHLKGLAGMLAMTASNNKVDRDKFVASIISDFRVFVRASEKAENNLFIAELLQSSPFHTPLMQDIVYLFIAPDHRSEQWRHDKLFKYATLIFEGWGQTKVVEDHFNRMWDRETLDSKNMTHVPMQY